MAVEGAGDELTGRTATAARGAGGDVVIRAVLPRLIDTTAFNLAFLIVMEAATAS
ncbi:hypothetical protein BDFG_05273 [Blastomyces dermatitidis ATCC 26199]|nr:hypothetical protein BDFG_05273 [Blastomyces dermatitidis ATCC 26199]